jgi:hypothetical protein
MNIADIIILVFLFLWGVVAVRSISHQKGCGGCHDCDGNCKSGSCPNPASKEGKKSIAKRKE